MSGHVCPVWAGRLLASPVRRWFQNPDRMLGPHVRPGMTVLDVGCAMGFFSLPMARMVGPGGRVVCVDVQPGMIDALLRRARRADLHDRIDARTSRPGDLGVDDLAGQVDFALAFSVVHEVPDPAALFRQVCRALKQRARLLLAEPRGHVSRQAFDASLSLANEMGLESVWQGGAAWSRTALLEKKGAPPTAGT